MDCKNSSILIAVLLILFNLVVGGAGNSLRAQGKQNIIKSTKQADFQDTMRKLWEDRISVFLSGANPQNRAFAEMRQMMQEHPALTTNELVAYLKKIGLAILLFTIKSTSRF